MSEARDIVYRWRWPPKGVPVCPRCGCAKIYETQRLLSGIPRHMCSACLLNFSALSGTIFSSAKKPFDFFAEAITLLSQPNWGTIGTVAKTLRVNYRTAWAITDKWVKSGGKPNAT